jgi:hypothetical protein
MVADRKGSYFFVLDAFIGGVIFVLTLVLVFSLFVGPTRTEQSFATASDYLTFLSTTEIRDFHHINVTKMREEGNITDPTITIAQQLVVFHNQTPIAETCTLCQQLVNTTIGSIPKTTAVNISISTPSENESFYTYAEGDVSKMGTHIVTKSIEYALINETVLLGPVAIIMEVWI